MSGSLPTGWRCWVGLATIAICAFAIPATAATTELVYGGIPLATDMLGGLAAAEFVVLPSRAFVVGYSDTRMNPLWACYRVDATIVGETWKSVSWRVDPRTTARVADADYAHTAGDYDRGHMAPRAAILRCFGQEAAAETYRLSNASPQLHALNDGIWGDLEDVLREEYSQTLGDVWVTVGPIFDDGNGRAFLTKEPDYVSRPQKPVEIPDAFYAIVVDLEGGIPRALAFRMPHEVPERTTATRKERLAAYLTSIDELEALTGLDFLWLLDDETEAELEKSVAQALW
ncbi:MAG: DNA/RNA non-specific endonuclease [Candidatus Bipolaricaulota bacterium]